MEYQKKELHNNSNNLLRRTQRQMNQLSEKSFAPKESSLSESKSSINKFFEESEIEVPSNKSNRIKQRGGR
jgi:hypothetical protein